MNVISRRLASWNEYWWQCCDCW